MSDLFQTEASLEVPIEGRDDLVRFFDRGSRPPGDWRVGTEYEKVAVDPTTGRAAAFSGPRGIEEVLRRLASDFGWTPRLEGDRIVALQGDRATITLEPGAQLELSGQQCDTIHCAWAELAEHVREVVRVGHEVGIAFLGLGVQPLSRAEEIERVPKRRYELMWRYMPTVGDLGRAMMKETATVQANFDYADGHDAMEKIRVGTGVSPIVTAAFANSPISGGALNGYMSYRQHVWTRTDPDRCGLLPLVFSPDAGFEDYADWAAGVSMYFIQRDGRLLDLDGMPFRDFLEHGFEGHRATLADWNLHLTTLFPEVRLKTYIEVRSADSQPPERLLTLPALFKGILYEPDCRLAAWDLVKKWSWDERLEVYHASHREALEGQVRGIRLLELARELVAIAREGLSRQNQRNSRGENEAFYLEPLVRDLEDGYSPAAVLVQRWTGEWEGHLERLIDATTWRIDDDWEERLAATRAPTPI